MVPRVPYIFSLKNKVGGARRRDKWMDSAGGLTNEVLRCD
jgi:hypothetical protein